MAAYQMMGSKYPVVSVDSASSALSDMKADFEYLNSFETIVINFDNDEAGEKAARSCKNLGFPLGTTSATGTGTREAPRNTPNWNIDDNVTLIRGRHMMKTGLNILRQQMNVFYSGNNGRSGYINFGGRFTAANALRTASSVVA